MPTSEAVFLAEDSRPIYVNGDMPTLPTITIGQRERRLLDFYYALPQGDR